MYSCYNSRSAIISWSKEWESIQKQPFAKTICSVKSLFFCQNVLFNISATIHFIRHMHESLVVEILNLSFDSPTMCSKVLSSDNLHYTWFCTVKFLILKQELKEVCSRFIWLIAEWRFEGMVSVKETLWTGAGGSAYSRTPYDVFSSLPRAAWPLPFVRDCLQ